MFPHKSPGKSALRALLCAISLVCTGSLAQWLPVRLTDPGDGMLDLSEHLLEHRGILPVPIVITEPAVGYGGGLVGIFFDKPLGQYSEAEALAVIEAIVTAWTEAMVAHHEASKYPAVRGLEPYETTAATPAAGRV